MNVNGREGDGREPHLFWTAGCKTIASKWKSSESTEDLFQVIQQCHLQSTLGLSPNLPGHKWNRLAVMVCLIDWLAGLKMRALHYHLSMSIIEVVMSMWVQRIWVEYMGDQYIEMFWSKDSSLPVHQVTPGLEGVYFSILCHCDGLICP